MGWTYLCLTESTYSPGTEDSASHLASGSDLSLIVKTIDTLKEYFSHGWLSRSYPVHRYGMTSTPSQPRYSEEQMLFMVDSHARTSVMQDLEEAWKESEADYSTNCCEWPKKYSPDSSFSKMFLPFELEAWWLLSLNLPIWGMTVDGLVYLPKKLEPTTYVNDGSCWPTPTARDYKGARKPETLAKAGRGPRNSLPDFLRGVYSIQVPSTQLYESMMGLPIGHSGLSALAMAWYRNKDAKHSKD